MGGGVTQIQPAEVLVWARISLQRRVLAALLGGFLGTLVGGVMGLSLVGFSSSRLLSHMNLGLGVLLFGNRGPRWPRFRHEATYYQSITSDQQADNRDDATRKTTQHAWARTLRGGATSHMRLG